MKAGYLSQYFEKVAAKRLSAVEVDSTRSHQHEFNGTKELREVLGTNDNGEKMYFNAKFVWMGQENEAITAEGQLSWYDSRFGKPRAAEWRLYFPTTDVSELSKPGDLMIIAKRTDNSVMIIVSAAGSTIENQLLWLFGLPVNTGINFTLQFIEEDDKEVDFAVRFILDELGIDVEEPEADYLDSILEKFAGKLPTTKEFSLLTRQTLKDINPKDDPDATIIAWMNHEEKLFRRMERHDVDKRLREGFISNDETDVDGFIKFSLSIQNRRKSRAGLALENHLEEIFRIHEVYFDRVVETENKSKPDFLFPGGKFYHDNYFPVELLTILGVKTSCKERWRQVLAEAKKIDVKHLLTLEPGISENQTDEMQAHRLQLVLPESMHETYLEKQRSWLINIKEFIGLVKERQSKISIK